MNKSQKKAMYELIEAVDSPYLCDAFISLLEAKRVQLGADYQAGTPR